jgi:hypothetical protein
MKLSMPTLSVNREVKVGDVFTALTILISLTTVLVSWKVDRKTRLTAQADQIRIAAADTLGELERCNDLLLSIYTRAQSVIVDASEIATSHTETKSLTRAESARDFLWKKLNEIHTAILNEIVDERVDNGYIKLFSYYPSVRGLYKRTLDELRKEDANMLQELLGGLEVTVISSENGEGASHSASVGNALRATALRVQSKYKPKFQLCLTTTEKFLTDKIEADDNRLLSRGAASTSE